MFLYTAPSTEILQKYSLLLLLLLYFRRKKINDMLVKILNTYLKIV